MDPFCANEMIETTKSIIIRTMLLLISSISIMLLHLILYQCTKNKAYLISFSFIAPIIILVCIITKLRNKIDDIKEIRRRRMF